ncbi:hypothetical protein [Vulcaniibacterium gelatinicum]|uniref:hypothetical protein n=1 Tax=Vulcaniibacterium gelatinicum TaxID=2598725 RepID=UPI0011C8F843|nr:hypothetical protein [Vulcaniibacterium gelatinicum]
MRFRCLAAVAAAGLFVSTAAAEPLLVPRPVPYAEDNDISDNIKTECRINEQLADFIREYAGATVELRPGPLDTSRGRVLELEIVDAVSMGNAWLGHQKYTKVQGTLWENGSKVASFRARRNSMGGAFAGYKGSCSVLGRTVKAIARDIATWLQAPRDGAVMGD